MRYINGWEVLESKTFNNETFYLIKYRAGNDLTTNPPRPLYFTAWVDQDGKLAPDWFTGA